MTTILSSFKFGRIASERFFTCLFSILGVGNVISLVALVTSSVEGSLSSGVFGPLLNVDLSAFTLSTVGIECVVGGRVAKQLSFSSDIFVSCSTGNSTVLSTDLSKLLVGMILSSFIGELVFLVCGFDAGGGGGGGGGIVNFVAIFFFCIDGGSRGHGCFDLTFRPIGSITVGGNRSKLFSWNSFFCLIGDGGGGGGGGIVTTSWTAISPISFGNLKSVLLREK